MVYQVVRAGQAAGEDSGKRWSTLILGGKHTQEVELEITGLLFTKVTWDSSATHTLVYAWIHVHIYSCTLRHMCTDIQSHAPTFTCAHTLYMHTLVHMQTHTYTHLCVSPVQLGEGMTTPLHCGAFLFCSGVTAEQSWTAGLGHFIHDRMDGGHLCAHPHFGPAPPQPVLSIIARQFWDLSLPGEQQPPSMLVHACQ